MLSRLYDVFLTKFCQFQLMVATPHGHHGTHVQLPVVEEHSRNSDLVQIHPRNMAVLNVPVLRQQHRTAILITVQVCNFKKKKILYKIFQLRHLIQ